MSHHRLASFAAVLLVSSAVSHAVRPAPAPEAAPATPAPAADAAKTEAVPAYELKNKSKFGAADPSARAPFWPIGWVKRPKGAAPLVAAPVAPKVLVDEKAFKVTSILIGSGTTPSLAVINGRAYSEGEFLRMPKGTNPPVRIRVQRINDGTVILQNADQVLVAALARPELSEKKSEELLLDPDR
jgi:hypothetical protein